MRKSLRGHARGASESANRVRGTPGRINLRSAQQLTGPGMQYGTDENADVASKSSTAALAFANIGLQDSALDGAKAQRHLDYIRHEVAELIEVHDVCIICFCEVGDSRKGLREDLRIKFAQTVEAGLDAYQEDSLSRRTAIANTILLSWR